MNTHYAQKRQQKHHQNNRNRSLDIITLFKFIPVREDPGLVGLCEEDDDSCLKNSLGFMERWDTNAAASCKASNKQ